MRTTRKQFKRKSTRRRRFNISRKVYIKRNKMVNQLTTKRFVVKISQNGDDVVNYGGAGVTFNLTDLPNSSEFTGLFDQYMIKGIQYRWLIRRDPAYVTTTANKGFSPRLGWVHDHDSAQTVSAFTEIQQYPRYNEKNFTANSMSTRWFYLKPAVANSVYNGVYNGYSAMWRKWLDSGYPGTPHYGIRYYYEGLYTGETLQLECKYILRLKSVI